MIHFAVTSKLQTTHPCKEGIPTQRTQISPHGNFQFALQDKQLLAFAKLDRAPANQQLYETSFVSKQVILSERQHAISESNEAMILLVNIAAK